MRCSSRKDSPNQLSPSQVKSVSLEKQNDAVSGVCSEDISRIPTLSLYNEILLHWSWWWQRLRFSPRLSLRSLWSRKLWENEENLSRERKSRQNLKWQISFVLRGSRSHVWNTDRHRNGNWKKNFWYVKKIDGVVTDDKDPPLSSYGKYISWRLFSLKAWTLVPRQ